MSRRYKELVFNIDKLRRVVEHEAKHGKAGKEELLLVKDDGVYLMAAARNPAVLVYADGCDPTGLDRRSDEYGDMYERCREIMGGDDSIDSLPLEDFTRIFAKNPRKFTIRVKPEAFELIALAAGTPAPKPEVVENPEIRPLPPRPPVRPKLVKPPLPSGWRSTR